MKPYKLKQINDKILLKKGKYLCVDPCYVLHRSNHDKWSEFCDRLYDGDDRKEGIVTDEPDGNEFLCIGTKYGDGNYPIYENNIKIGGLSVDAGLLSVIPLKLAKSWGKFDENSKHWKIIDLKEDSEFNYANGNFEFGPFLVITDGSDDKDECERCGCDCNC